MTPEQSTTGEANATTSQTRFGIKHRVSSAYKPHSNQLAEGAVKAAKRMLRDNTGAQGT